MDMFDFDRPRVIDPENLGNRLEGIAVEVLNRE